MFATQASASVSARKYENDPLKDEEFQGFEQLANMNNHFKGNRQLVQQIFETTTNGLIYAMLRRKLHLVRTCLHERQDEFRSGIKVVLGRKTYCLHEQFHPGI